MPTRRDLERLRRAQGSVVDAARRELGAFMAMLPSDADQAAAAVAEFFPALVRSYGDVGAALAAEWFEETAPSRGLAQVVLADPLPWEQLQATGGWAADEPGKTGQRLAGALQRYILAPGRRTIRLSAAASGARWARVPTRADCCAFCAMLSSRTDYTSERAAGGIDADQYHNDCGCIATPLWRGEPLPEGYDPEFFMGRYRSARDEAGGDVKDILAAMRQQYGIG